MLNQVLIIFRNIDHSPAANVGNPPVFMAIVEKSVNFLGGCD